MIFIAHRGNINGIKSNYENGQKYCQEAIDNGYHVEIDVHWYEGIFWTGHDRPQYRVNTDFLKKKEVWCHAKDIQVLYQLQEIEAHCFLDYNNCAGICSDYIAKEKESWTFKNY